MAVVRRRQQPEKVRLVVNLETCRPACWCKSSKVNNNVNTISQQDNMMIAPFHRSWQIIKMNSDLVRLIVRNLTLIE